MYEVFWLEQVEADVPPDDNWLGPGEALRLRSIQFQKRRADWRLGRWTAKRALTAFLGGARTEHHLRRIEILPEACGAPCVFWLGKPAPVTLSLTHRGGVAASAVARARVTLGCDLELVEPHTQAFVEDYFTPEEKELIARASCDERSRAIALLWSAKESLLKALRTGLRADTRSAMIESVESDSAGNGNGAGRWAAIRARTASGQPFHGWWREADGLVRTLIGPPGTLPPVALPV